MALDKGTVRISDGYDATKPLRVSRFTIRDDHPKKRWLSVPEILIYSSNIGAAKMALDVGSQAQLRFLDKVGLLSQPRLELPELGRPQLQSPWRDINTMTAAYGHGVAVSPMQLAAGFAALVNGGVLVRPTLVPQTDNVPVGERVISQHTSSLMRKLLRLVVTEGTGGKADVPGLLVGGKTGTAEKFSNNGGYNRKALLSSFVAAFPMNDPKYVVYALLDEPKGNKKTHGFASAGWTAAPAAGRIIARIASILDVLPVDEEAPEIRHAMDLPAYSREAKLASISTH
jgi:cell division protein FtsI (penicillin-binding protein 3)